MDSRITIFLAVLISLGTNLANLNFSFLVEVIREDVANDTCPSHPQFLPDVAAVSLMKTDILILHFVLLLINISTVIMIYFSYAGKICMKTTRLCCGLSIFLKVVVNLDIFKFFMEKRHGIYAMIDYSINEDDYDCVLIPSWVANNSIKTMVVLIGFSINFITLLITFKHSLKLHNRCLEYNRQLQIEAMENLTINRRRPRNVRNASDFFSERPREIGCPPPTYEEVMRMSSISEQAIEAQEENLIPSQLETIDEIPENAEQNSGGEETIREEITTNEVATDDSVLQSYKYEEAVTTLMECSDNVAEMLGVDGMDIGRVDDDGAMDGIQDF